MTALLAVLALLGPVVVHDADERSSIAGWRTAGWPGRWGAARAGLVPGEMDSPRGSAFQPDGRWTDPEAWARRARPCTFGRCDEAGECDTRESLIGVALPGAALLILLGALRRRSSRHAEHPQA